MLKKTILFLALTVLTSSCVTKKIYNELENKLTQLQKEHAALTDENSELEKAKKQVESEKESLGKELTQSQSELEKLQADFASTQKKFKVLQDAYVALEKNSGEALQSNLKKNQALLAELDAKSKALAIEKERLSKSAQRLQELEDLIASKEAAMKDLKETLSKALNGFEGKGLTVEQKNGKVYVSMENKLLFNSGSWAVGSEGRKAVVEVAKVLGENPEIAVLIEGHTDNDDFKGTGPIADNWDLSTKRATAIVTILSENKKVNKQNLTAAGRSEYAPLQSNATAEGKAKNRRIEIILTPRLDEISKMLNEF